jgi:hypothetical protein
MKKKVLNILEMSKIIACQTMKANGYMATCQILNSTLCSQTTCVLCLIKKFCRMSAPENLNTVNFYLAGRRKLSFTKKIPELTRVYIINMVFPHIFPLFPRIFAYRS